MFQDCTSGLVESFFEGYNATVFAYGQTGSGKTFTMGSSTEYDTKDNLRGLIPRVLEKVFEKCESCEQKDPSCSFTLKVQFLEIK